MVAGLVLLSAIATAASPVNIRWEVLRRPGGRVELTAVAVPGATTDAGPAAAVLIPAAGGRLPELLEVELDTIAVVDVSAGGVESRGDWLSFGTPARAAGLDVVPLVLNRARWSANGKSLLKGARVVFKADSPTRAGRRPNAMARLIEGYIEQRSPEVAVDQPGYLIIVPDEFVASVAPLAEWKQRKGFRVWTRRLSETGATREEIRDYIADAYRTWDPVPSYVLLVGAVNKLPAFITAGTPCVTDHPYACVDGDDYLADLFVGRLPAANASELDVIVAKTVGYERTPVVDDTNWYRRALMVATSYQEGGTPAVTAIVTKQVIREQMLGRGFVGIDTVYYPPTRYGRGPVDSAVNRGVVLVNGRGWGNYDGWGYPQFLTNDVYGLNNGWKLPVVTSIYCGTGNYARNPCFGEAWLRAGSPTNPRGGVAFWGSSWTGTSTRWNNCMDYGIYHALFGWGLTVAGPAMYAGKLSQYLNFPLPEDSFDLRVYFHVYNLLGDPSLGIWTGVPWSLSVSHPGSVPTGTSAFDVLVRDQAARPVAGAVVAIDGHGGPSTAMRTDEAGHCRLAIDATSADSLFVTVTGPNLRTSSTRVAVRQAGVFVGHASHTPDECSPGAQLDLAVTLHNFGSSVSAPNVEARLHSADGAAVVIDSVRSYGNIGAGASATAPAFAVRPSPGCTARQRLMFWLEVRSNDSAWTSAFEVPVAGPTLRVIGYTVHGGGGWLVPGAASEISIKVLNSGDRAARSVAGSLTSLNPAAVLVDDSLGAFGTIDAGDSAANTGDRFSVICAAGVGIGRRFSLGLRLTGADGFEQRWDFPVTVGQPRTNAPLGPDHYGYYAYDDTDTGYAERPSFDWLEIDPGHGGAGTRLTIGNDTAVTISLPFQFRFYGRPYSRISVSDNGYAAVGPTWFGDIYNWHIPSANGPDGLVAAFWDDFRADTLDASGICTYFDAASHRFLIEWSRCRHVHGFRPPIIGELQTYQLALYDPAYHPTATGDGPMLVQYLTVANDDSAFGNSHNFATVGIQNPDHNDGIEYTFAGRYPAAAAEVVPGRAIRFTTNPPDTFTALEVEMGPLQPRLTRVAPSPATECLWLHLTRAVQGGLGLQLVDVGGRMVNGWKLRGDRADVRLPLRDVEGRRLPDGVYCLRMIRLTDGLTIATHRVAVVGGRRD